MIPVPIWNQSIFFEAGICKSIIAFIAWEKLFTQEKTAQIARKMLKDFQIEIARVL